LTARAAKRRKPARKGVCLLFSQAEITLEKGRKRKTKMPEKNQHATWGELLGDAVEKPGRMLEALGAGPTRL
jgi:hypothetical protein